MLNFKITAQNNTFEYLIKLPEQYFINYKDESLRDSMHVQKYFETNEKISIEKVFKESSFDLFDWIKVRSSKEMHFKFSDLRDKGKIYIFQKNNRYRIQSIPNDSLYAKQWYHKKIEAASSWTNYNPVENIILAIIDTGIDYNHPDLKNNIWINHSEDLNNNNRLDSLDINGIDDDGNGYIDDVFGWDFTDAPRFPDNGDYLNPDNDPMDEFQSGHGTQIAGIISAQANNTIGIAGLTPQIKVMNLRAGTASGYLEEDDVAKAIVYAVENGARVINMSFGDVVVSSFMKDVIKYAYNQNIVLIASSGNSGTNEPHYPSGFAETISVGATDSLDNITGFSSWGQTLDLVAPGQNIISTKIGHGYNYSNGTSFSAPMVASAAVFILSNYPHFTNEQVRNILKSTTDDFGSVGWDPYYGSGRLNLFRVSQTKYQSELHFEYPKSGMYSSQDTIPIIVTIQDVDLSSASLQLGEGENPTTWQTIISNITSQVISDTLMQLNVSEYTDTTLVLRLVLNTWDGVIKETRSVLNIDKSAPTISNLNYVHLFDANKNSILITFNTDDITRGEIHLIPESSSLPVIIKDLNYETKNHKILISSEDISDSVAFELHIQNLAGLPTTGGGTSRYQFYLSPEIIPDFNFARVNYNLPKGYLLPKTTDFDKDGNREIVVSLYNEFNSFGNTAVFEFENNNFQKRAETGFPAIPRDYGDADGDGKMELLLGFGRKSYVYEASSVNGFPDQIVWNDSSDFWVTRIADLDQDGVKEIIGRSANGYKIKENISDNAYTDKYIFTNNTSGNNALGPPSVLYGDFDDDSFLDIVFGDYDGDFLIYENTGNDAFIQRTAVNLPLIDATDFFTAGNFTSDQKKSFIIGTHTDDSKIYESEFNARYWSFSHYASVSDNNYINKQTINFFGYADIREYDSGISTGIDTIQYNDYALFSVYPDLYIFQSNGDSLEPKWYSGNIQSNKIIINDFDKNGAPEIYFNNGDSIIAYEFGISNRPLPPSNFEAIPLDTHSVELSWQLNSSAQKVIIYRGLTDSTLALYDSVFSEQYYIDSMLTKDIRYFYALKTYDVSYINPYSNLSEIETARPNDPAIVDSLFVINSNQLQVYFNEPMQISSFSANNFKILPQQKFASSAIPLKNGLGVLITFPITFKKDSLNTLILFDVRDIDKTLIATESNHLNFYFLSENIIPYVKSWELNDRFDLFVNFNIPMDTATVLNLNNYDLEPGGHVIEVEQSDVYDMSFKLTLSKDSYAGATGIPTYINFMNIRASNGVLFEKGSRFNLTKSALNLENMLVYPQPVTRLSEFVTFANITENTEIKIYDINGNFIRELKESNRDGGTVWDMKNNRGEKVASGIYIYHVSNKKETKIGKIAIIR